MNNSYVYDLKNIFIASDFDSIEDNFSIFSGKIIVLKSDVVVEIDTDKLEELVRLISRSDLVLTVTISKLQQTINISSNSLENLISRVDSYLNYLDYLDEGDKVSFEFHIKKIENKLHVFDFRSFEIYLSTLSMQECLEHWGGFDFRSVLEVDIWEGIAPFNTSFIYFSSVYPNSSDSDFNFEIKEENRNEKIENRDKSGHFVNAQKINLIPEDFLLSEFHEYHELKLIFNALHNLLLISFLSDFSSISNNEFHYRIKGYKLLSGIIGFKDLKSSQLLELNKIYSWVYLDGNFADKIGLARNVISIHLADESILSIENGASDSVDSAYDLYLKENVKQYIEIKNKVNEFLQSQSDKSQELTKNVFVTIKTSILAFATFFSSVFLLRVLSGKDIKLEFSSDVVLVSFLLVAFFSIYFIVSIVEINMDKKRLAKRYFEVKDRYKDLLSESNLMKIIDAKRLSEDEVGFIDKRRNMYIVAWILICTVTLGTVYWLYKPSSEAATSLPANMNIDPEEIILHLDNAHIDFSPDKDNSFLTPPKS